MVVGQTENYIKTTNYKLPTTTSISNPSITQAHQNITYFDGLFQQVDYWYLLTCNSNGVLPTSTSSIKTEADAGLLENFTFCFEPEIIVAQLDNNSDDVNKHEKIVFFIFFKLRLIYL